VGVAEGRRVDVGRGVKVDVGRTRVGVGDSAGVAVAAYVGVGALVGNGVADGATGVISLAVGATIDAVGVFVAGAIVASGDGVAALAPCSWSRRSVAANRKAIKTVRITTTSAPRPIANCRGSNCFALLLELATVNDPKYRN